jgi:hypothetical protein
MICLCLFLHILVGIIPKHQYNVLYGIKKTLAGRKISPDLAQPLLKKGDRILALSRPPWPPGWRPPYWPAETCIQLGGPVASERNKECQLQYRE